MQRRELAALDFGTEASPTKPMGRNFGENRSIHTTESTPEGRRQFSMNLLVLNNIFK